MTSDWTLKVRREYAGGDARYEFPVRSLGWGRLVGLFLVGFGGLFIWHPAHDVGQTVLKWWQGTPGKADIFSSLFELPFMIAGCVPMAIGLVILFGRCRVEWKDGQLRTAEILGPLCWIRRLPRQPINKLEVGAATSTSRNSAPRPLEGFSCLVAKFEDGPAKLVVIGYPKDWLLALAEELKGYVGGGTLSGTPTQVEVVEQLPQNENDADVPEQPSGSLVQVVEQAGGIRFNVPPAGVWRGSKGFFMFPLVWCGFMTVITTVLVLPGTKRESPLWIIILILLGFWAVGLGMMAFAINLGRRRAEVVVESGRLRVETKGLLGTKQWEWSRDQIAAIRADRSGMEVNHKPVIELQVHPSGGKKVGLLAGQDETELRWMATRLRQVLHVPARKPEP